MRLILTVILFLGLTTSAVIAQGAVTATVDRKHITEFDLLTLTLRVTGDNTSEPDPSPLERNFEIVGQQSQQNSSIYIITKHRGGKYVLLSLLKVNILLIFWKW